MSQSQDRLSIVLPVRNRASIVGRTLRSIASQVYRPIDVILVDNGSEDDTRSVLQQWLEENDAPDFNVRLFDEPVPGACRARNRGLAEVRTDWTMFFDSDDVMLPQHVQRAMSFIAAHPDAEVVGWDKRRIGLDGSRIITGFTSHYPIYNNIMFSTMGTLNYMARTIIFKRSGCWNESLNMGDDAEMGHRILLLNPICYKISAAPLVEVYETISSISNAPFGRAAALSKSLLKIKDKLPLKYHYWCDIKLLIMLAYWAKDDPDSDELRYAALSRLNRFNRLLGQLLYHYTKCGGRGALRIYSLMLSKKKEFSYAKDCQN